VQAAALLPTCCVLHYIGGSFRFHSFRIQAMTELNNSNPRQLLLLQEVQRRSAATVEELAAFLGVTLQTVRRDVQRLSEAGVLTRFHGGVRVPNSTTENLAHQQREALNADGKTRIAQAVAAQVPHNCSLILNIGTTTEAIARALMQHRGLRIITNNLNVAATLSSNPDCEDIVAGGVVRGRDRGIIGEAAVDFIRQFRVDIALIGISGIESDGSKFGRPAMVEVGPLSRIDRLFTDAPPPDPFPRLLQEAHVRCTVA